MSPCDKQTVILRQEFFQNMENTAFLEHIHKLLGILRTINAEKYHYSQTELNAERTLLHLRVLHLYRDMHNQGKCSDCLFNKYCRGCLTDSYGQTLDLFRQNDNCI